ncbi:AAA-domain-containing protein [Suillus weaverae]|nr:AAA-domain-containing protein [Suillus weaverae]
MPEGVRKVFDNELNKLMGLEPAASEANVTPNYLEWLTWYRGASTLPRTTSTPSHTLRQSSMKTTMASKTLKTVYWNCLLWGSFVQGKIICLVWPPGVGKTLIGKSIVRALNMQFFRFSVGGLTDVAEIKGHPRTYVGALPGKIIQALKSLAGAVIRWACGTGLMDATNVVADEVESHDVRTFSEKDMAFNILGLMHPLLVRV